MPLPSFSFARLLGLSALFFGLLLGCGGGSPQPPPPSPPQAPPDASRSSVSVNRGVGVRADGQDRVAITVTVRDATGKALSGQTVSVVVSGEGNTVTQPEGTTDASGVAIASVVSTEAGLKLVTASVEHKESAVVLSERPGITFVSAPAAKLAFLATSLSATAGEPVEPVVEVAVQDQAGRTIPGASNEVSLLLAAGPASAGLEGTLAAQAVNGIARFPGVVLKQAGSGYQLKATSSGLADGTSPTFEVAPALPSSAELGLPASVPAGSEAGAVVTIRDSFGNVATSYRGTVRFSSTAPGAMLPADYTFTAADRGRKSFSVTLGSVGSWEIRVEDTTTPALAAQGSVMVQPGAAAQLVLTAAPGPFEAGEEFSLQVVVRDAFGNDVTGYQGAIRFTSTDLQAVLPADYTFTPADEGRSSFNVVLGTAAGSQRITVADRATPALTATLEREVVPGAPTRLRFATQPANGRVRAALPTVGVELVDAFGNRARVSSPAVVVALKGGNAGAVLSGTVSVAPVDGLATFSALSVDQEGNGFQLTAAAAAALAPVDSTSFGIIDDIPPRGVTLTSTGQDVLSISLAWSASGDDGNLGAATSYQLRYSTSPLSTRAEFDAATLATSGTPGAPESTESFTVTGLSAATTYFFAVVTWDGAGNASAPEDLQVATVDPCEGVVCEPPAPTCAADNVTRVTFSSACVLEGTLPTCQDTEARMTCPGQEGVCFAGACTTAARPEAGELTITEVMHSAAQGTTDYVEIHNPTQKLLNVTGLRLENEFAGSFTTFTLAAPSPGAVVLIPPGEWFVVAERGEFDVNGGVPVDYALGNTFYLDLIGRIILRSVSGAAIEDFSWSSSFPQTPGRSMNLAAAVTGTQANWQPWYWCDSSVNVPLPGGDHGTPGQPNETCGLNVGPAPTFCNIQYPKTFPEPSDPVTYPAVIPYGSRKTIYTQFSGPSLTDRNSSGNDDYPHVQVELGYGAGADPAGWQWSAARFNPFYDDLSPAFDPLKDEAWGWLRIFTPGTYAYGFRYRLYDPAAGSFSGYTYCDQNGVASVPASGVYGSVTVGTAPLGTTDHIVISEFAPRGTNGMTDNEDDEFLELYNPTSAPVDLSGWKVQYMPAGERLFETLVTIPAGVSIAAKGYYLIAHNAYAGSAAPNLRYAQAIPSTGGNVRIGRPTVGSGIRDIDAVDNLGWGAAYAPEGDAAPAPGTAGSLERKAALLSTAETMEGGADATRGNGLDSDWNADDFVIRAARGPQNSVSPPETP
ncbi:MAG: lamin tail domain-containing protein [Myxococcaceae bacterium]|nr:lamin tail domain-containing protein [Myxococcaceae bacterium]